MGAADRLRNKVAEVVAAHPQQFTTAYNEPIPDNAAIRLTLTLLTNTGVFTNAVALWRRKTQADQMLANFNEHFNFENKEHRLHLTAKCAGYRGAKVVQQLFEHNMA